jgi:hypothetical protein
MKEKKMRKIIIKKIKKQEDKMKRFTSFTIVLLLITAGVVYGSDSLVGIWNGTLKFEKSLKVNLNVEKSDDGLLAAFSSLEMGLNNMPVNTIKQEEQRVTFSISNIGVKFEGTLSNDGKAIDGNWLQGQDKFLLNLKGEKIISGIVGTWQGYLHVSQKLRLRLKVKKVEEKFQATMDSLDQGANDIPVDEIKCDENQVTFVMNSLGASFVGTLDEKGTIIDGSFSQSGTTLPLIFNKESESQETKNP